MPGEAATAATPAVAEPARPVRAAAADRADRTGELLDWTVSNIFNVGMSLQAAAGLPRDLTARRFTEALGRLDDMVREIRHHVFAERGQPMQPGLAGRRTADTAALLEQRADLFAQPARIDYRPRSSGGRSLPMRQRKWQNAGSSGRDLIHGLKAAPQPEDLSAIRARVRAPA